MYIIATYFSYVYKYKYIAFSIKACIHVLINLPLGEVAFVDSYLDLPS